MLHFCVINDDNDDDDDNDILIHVRLEMNGLVQTLWLTRVYAPLSIKLQ